jgi:hypothetical protein
MDGPLELHKSHFADNTRHGSVNYVFKILERYPMLSRFWFKVSWWVIEALSTEDFETLDPVFVPRNPQREAELKAWFLLLKQKGENEVNDWLNKTCDKFVEKLTEERCDGHDLSVLLTGGGLVDKKIYDRFTQTIRARIPHVTIVDNRASETKQGISSPLSTNANFVLGNPLCSMVYRNSRRVC